MGKLKVIWTALLMSAVVALIAGCASDRVNVMYSPPNGNPNRIDMTVKGAIIPTVDMRDKTRIYPKQIILHTGYSDDKTYDINDKSIDQVFDEAFAAELFRLGVGIVDVRGIEGPLDKLNKDRIRTRLMQEYPEVKVAFGAKVKDFFASSKRNVVTTDVAVTANIEFYVLDIQTGELLWSEYGTDWQDTVASADREDLVEKLNESLSELMMKSVRNNLSLRDLLVKVGNRR